MSETVDWDVRTEVERIINQEWSLSQDYTIKQDDDHRGARPQKDVLMVLEETRNRQFEASNAHQSTFDKRASVMLHMVKPNQNTIGLNQVWKEVMSCLLTNRRELDGLQGNWDYITIDNIDTSTEVRESEFTIRVNFNAHSHSFDGSVGQ